MYFLRNKNGGLPAARHDFASRDFFDGSPTNAMRRKVEILRPMPANMRITFCMTDWDGTLSLLRSGWPELMLQTAREALTEAGARGERLEGLISQYGRKVSERTGQPTIRQMMALEELIENETKVRMDRWKLKEAYNARLDALRRERIRILADDPDRRKEFLVAGAVEFFEALKERGVQIAAVSGSDHETVLADVKALGLGHLFGKSVFGYDRKRHGEMGDAKESVIRAMIQKEGLAGNNLLVVGDGPIELEVGERAGGCALALVSNEGNDPTGINTEAEKRRRLMAANPHLLIYDFGSLPELLSILEI